ncbi:Ig-like domain-containing protein [Brevibacillus agri]|uniref:OmpL47-type beta-barrel domain-containing protein n=1 Tax=Brevibacillus agri TaxID=51101 RepID=UPI0025B6E583|nr:Ig-like domain-containing protein [Brevibacillus agri]MDN4093586.1 Ig-like domain-containing protein [Brevibacillus agri]
MAQTILSGFDDVWVSAENYNTVKGTANPSIYSVVQFVIRRTSDQKLFFGYKVNSKQAGTIAVSVTGNAASAGYVEAKNSSGTVVGSPSGYDGLLSKFYQASGTSAIMVYPSDRYPGVKTARYYGEYEGTKLCVTIQYGTDSYLLGYFETTATDVSRYLNAKPSIALTSPTNNQVVSNVSGRRTITISGTVADANSNTVTISATINGKTKTTSVAATPTAKSWSLTWDVVTDNIAQGTYTNIVVTADDGQGGTATATYTGTITVDKTSPDITISGVANGATYQNSVTPTFSATDSGGSGLASVTATLDGAAYTSGTAITASGSHTLVVTATDNAGNQAQQTVTFSVNKAPTIDLIQPSENLLGTDGNCENTSKFTYTGGTAALDSTRKTQGNNSIKLTKTSTGTTVSTQSSRSTYPAVGECYIAIADVYLENSASGLYIASVASGVGIKSKYVTGQLTGFVLSTTGVFIPVIRAFEVTSVSSPGVSDFYPQIYHSGTSGHLFNVDSFRVFKITKAQYDALPTNVDLATAQSIAAQYPYVDPNTNQTLQEGSTFNVQGSASDVDSGNVVTIKYKINNGTTRALSSGVSDGSSPISFAKTLTYHDKRIWDGTTDITGVDLAENTNHTLTVWAEDDQGGISNQETRTFTVIWNRPPMISGTDTDLGTINTPPTVSYSVTEPEGNTFTITEYLNGVQKNTFSGVDGQTYSFTIDHDTWIRLDLDVLHQIKIRATDSEGLYSDRIFTFIRTETHIEFILDYDNPNVVADFTLDAMPERVLVTLDRYMPAGSSIEFVKVCNNALDATPTWEDATGAVNGGRGYLFTNTTKTATDWAINIWVSINKGTATERVLLNGHGGAFD